MIGGKSVFFVAIFTLVSLIILLVIAIDTATANTIVVPDDYSGIQGALDNANDGDVIRIHSGTYFTRVTVAKSVTIIGNGTDTKIQVSDWSYPAYGFMVTADYVNISNLYFYFLSSGLGSVGINVKASHCRIENVTAVDLICGIKIEGGHHNLVTNCNLTENSKGIGLYDGSSYNHIFNISSSKNYENLEIEYGPHHNLIENSTFNGCRNRGITFYRAGDANKIINCTVYDNPYAGITSSYSVGLVLINVSVNNTGDRNGMSFYDAQSIRIINSTIGFSHDTGISLWRIEDIYLDGVDVSTTGWHGVAMGGSKNIQMINCTVEYSSTVGINIASSSNVSILRGIVRNCWNGINIEGSTNFSVKNCEILDTNMTGLWIMDSSVQEIIGTIAWVRIERSGLNDPLSGAAIHVEGYSTNMSIDNNTFKDNPIGLFLHNSSTGGMFVTTNQFLSNTVCAIENEVSAGPNLYHHNNFMGTKFNVINPRTDDVFDDGEEGNYWDDYRTRYPNAVQTGKIWDTPYEVAPSSSVFDRYPLAIPVDFISPIAMAGDNQEVPQNTTVQFNASASTDNIKIVNYTWSFTYNGSSLEGSGKVVNFTFDIVGTYLVTLTVIDLSGNSGHDFLFVFVIDTLTPYVDGGGDITVDMGEEFTLDASLSWDHVGIVGVIWTIDPEGLNVTLEGDVVPYSIDTPGTYLVVLNVSDLAGNWNSTTIWVYVRDIERPVAIAGDDMELDQGEEVEFNGSSSRDNVAIATWIWTFEYDGDDVTLEGETASFKFDISGRYEVTLKVTDVNGLWDMATLLVIVNDIQLPTAMVGEDVTIDQGTEVVFDGSGSHDNDGIIEFKWSFEYQGAPVELLGVEVRFEFQEVGSYVITLEVSDAAGNSATDMLTVTVLDITDPKSDAGQDFTVDLDEVFSLDASTSTDNVGIVNYSWKASISGTDRSFYGKTPQFSIGEVGIYEFTLEVVDARGNSDIDVISVTVIDFGQPVAVPGPDVVLIEGSSLVLDGSASSDNIGIVVYLWTFEVDGEDQRLTGEKVEYRFDIVGEFIITLTVSDAEGNQDSKARTVHVLPLIIEWSLGPFIDTKEIAVMNASVTLNLNGTTYEANTARNGIASFDVSRFDLIGEVQVTVEMDGYKTLEFVLTLDEENRPTGEIPPMEKKKKAESGFALGSMVMVSLGITALLITQLRRISR